MSNRAKYSGAVGTIVDGRVRDLQEHRDLDYPVFAKDVGTASPQELLRVSEVRLALCNLSRNIHTSVVGIHVTLMFIARLTSLFDSSPKTRKPRYLPVTI